MERKRPGVGKPLVLPGVGIADCRAFPGVVNIGEGYMSSGRLTLSEVVIIAVIRVKLAAIVRRKVRTGIQQRSHHMTRANCHIRRNRV